MKERIINEARGGLESTMQAHGPRLGVEDSASAVKRISGQLKAAEYPTRNRQTLTTAMSNFLVAYARANGPIRKCHTPEPQGSHVECARHLTTYIMVWLSKSYTARE